MNVLRPEIIELLASAESKYGRRLATTNDFEKFSQLLFSQSNQQLSASTLKRLWGYVNYPHTPRPHTLDTLAQFVGYNNFGAFCEELRHTPAYNSLFISEYEVLSRDLASDSELEIGWAPNRYLKLLYLGNSLFEVKESLNSKIQKGDKFETSCFMMGQPLLLPYILRNGKATLPFVAGQKGGLTILNLLQHG